jgi:hypothetical protein
LYDLLLPPARTVQSIVLAPPGSTPPPPADVHAELLGRRPCRPATPTVPVVGIVALVVIFVVLAVIIRSAIETRPAHITKKPREPRFAGLKSIISALTLRTVSAQQQLQPAKQAQSKGQHLIHSLHHRSIASTSRRRTKSASIYKIIVQLRRFVKLAENAFQ